MIHQPIVRRPATERFPNVPRLATRLYAAVNDQLTISGRLVEGGLSAARSGECATAEDGPVGAGEDQCPWLPFVGEQLQAMASLPEGWDSHGASRPDVRLIVSAQGLIECLAQVPDLPQPHVNPTRNGGVQFEWDAGERYFELEIVAERAATYLYSDEAARIEETGDVFEEDSLELVLGYIRSVGNLP